MNDWLRIAAVAAAAALVAAPYWPQIKAAASRALEAGVENAGTISRVVAAALLIAAAWGKIPIPQLYAVPAVVVPEPSPAMQESVAPVASALKSLTIADRALWAATWSKAALVVEAEGATSVAVFTDTASLRTFTLTTLDIAWRRIGGHAPGEVDGLRQSVEAAMRGALGLASAPVTPEVRKRYAEAARAIAWAGTR